MKHGKLVLGVAIGLSVAWTVLLTSDVEAGGQCGGATSSCNDNCSWLCSCLAAPTSLPNFDSGRDFSDAGGRCGVCLTDLFGLPCGVCGQPKAIPDFSC